MALQEYRDPTDQTRYGYDSSTGQGIAFSNPNTYSQYGFSGFNPNAPVANFDTSILKSNADKLVPVRAVMTSDNARNATYQNVTNLQQAEQGLTSPSPAQTLLNNQIGQSVTNMGGNLKMSDQLSLNAAEQLGLRETALIGDARRAQDSQDYRSLNSLMGQLSQIRNERAGLVNQIAQNLKKSELETQLQSQLSGIRQQGRNTELSAQSGFNKIESQPIPMDLVTGQGRELLKQANLQLQTLAAQEAPIIDQLKLAQETRQSALAGLQLALESNANDTQFTFQLIEMAREVEQIQKAEQQAAKKFTLDYQIRAPYYNVGGTIYRAADGKAYSTEQELLEEIGVGSWGEIPKGMIQDTVISPEERAMQLEREQFEFNKEFELFDRELDLARFDLSQQELIIQNQGDQNKPLTAEELIKFGGLPAGTTWGDVVDAGLSPERPLTEAQKSAAGYAARIQDANTILEDLQSTITKQSAFELKAQQVLPNWLKASWYQQFDQAQRNFINSVLRKESGAAIADSEFQNARIQYFPQPGDSKEVLDQKKKNRERVMSNLINDAGSAWQGNKPSLFELEQGGSKSTNPKANFIGPVPQKTGMRTDRHNNPAAFTTDVAKTAGLVLGKDYEIGDPFPNNPNLRTARLLGDPVAQTIKVIDRIGFYTQTGKPRWSYVGSLKGAGSWRNLGYDQKKAVVKQMYAHEGGTALKQYFA